MKYTNICLAAYCLLAAFVTMLSCTESPAPKNQSSEKSDQLDDFGLEEFEEMIAEFESNERVIWQKPDLVISLIDDIERKTVVDLGAGSGYFAFRLAGKAKKVIAIDIDKRWVSFMDSIKYHQLTDARLANFETRIGTTTSPNLKIAEADAVLVVNTYVYIGDRIAYFSNLRKNLNPKGRVIIVDYKPVRLPVGPDIGIKLSIFEVTQELQKAGYNIVSVDETSLQYQYIIIAESKY